MKAEYLIIIIIGVLVFLSSFARDLAFGYKVLLFICGCILVYLGIQLENDLKKTKQ